MMEPKQEAPAALVCEVSLEDHVRQDHLLCEAVHPTWPIAGFVTSRSA